MTLDFNGINQTDDGGVDGQGFHTGGVAGGTILAEKNKVTGTGVEGVDRNDGILPRFELGGILFVDQERT